MSAESIQQKLLRVRPPRVRITYDVETGGSSEKIELAFIVGMFANLSGDVDVDSLPAMKDRRMRDIDADSFDRVMADVGPVATLHGLPDLIAGDDAKLQGTLGFRCLADFEPLSVVKNVPGLSRRYDARGDLRTLQSMAESNDALAALLDLSTRDAAAMGALKTTFAGDTTDSWYALDIDADAPLPSPVEGADVPKALIAVLKGQMASNADAAATARTALDAANEAKKTADDANTAAIAAAKAAQDTATKADADLTAATAALAAASGDAAVAKANGNIADAGKAKEAADAALLAAQSKVAMTKDAAARTADTVARRQEAFVSIDPLSKARRLAGRYTREIIAPLGDKQLTQVVLGANGLIDERTGGIDVQIGRQLDVIMHSNSFQSLEATWRGLFYVVSRTESGQLLKLRVFNAEKEQLRKELEKAAEFDQSCIFKMIYEHEYGTYGGMPYSLLVGGYEFGRSANDIQLLESMTRIAASAHTPFVAAASPSLFLLDGYDKLANPRDLAQLFESPELAQWNEFRGSEDSRYVALVLPHVLLRLPYGKDSRPAEGLRYEETVTGEQGPDHGAFLWGNAAYVLAERITNAFALYHWTAAIRGEEGGGLVGGLPVYTYRDDAGLPAMICPTEVSITDRREKELNDLGFISLCNCKGTGQAAFFGGQTTNLPRQYISEDANANARLSSMLPYMLAASRFAHYIKVIMRKKIGAFLTRSNVEAYLNTWIAQYVLLDDNAPQDVKASYPLRAAQLNVTDVPGSPGAYKATVFIKPHFQLEELTTSIRLVADLPAG